MRAERRSGRRFALVVAGLVAWSVAEVSWRLHQGYPGDDVPVLLWAAAIPLPLLAVRRWPTAAALAVVALNLARTAAEQRVAGTAVTSVVVLVALFVAESQRSPTALPVRGIAIGLLLVGGTAALDVLGAGGFAHPQSANYPFLVMIAVGGVGAGVALRDRRAEVERLEHELRAARDRAAARLQSVVAAERTRIAAEIDGAVAVLLDRVRPLAARAAVGGPRERFVADMRTVEEAAMAAMTEMRRALRLLRGPAAAPPDEPSAAPLPSPSGAPLSSAVPPAPPPRAASDPRPLAQPELAVAEARAATRRTRLREGAWAAAPVALLAGVGLYEQIELPPLPVVLHPSHLVPAPEIGPASPLAMAVLGVAPLLWRGRVPLLATLAVCALLVVRMALHDLSALTWTQYYVAAAAAFLGAAHAGSRAAALVAGAGAIGAAVACMAMEQVPYDAADYVFVAMLPVAGVVAGLAVRDGVAVAARARRAREEVDRLHEEEAAARVEAERLSAARDLHDVIGHAVTVVGMQAAVARRYVDIDLDRAREAAAVVAEVAADAERDLARLTDVLESEPPADVAALVGRWGAAGMPVTLDDRLDRDRAPLPLAHVAFRIVQEALTNVGRHAGRVPTSVTVAGEGGELVVEVVNELGTGGIGPRRGGGIAGMRERAESYGGTLRAGPDGRGAWRVEARLPLDARASATAPAR